MSDKNYVISVMAKRYKSEEYEWKYFQYDDHSGSFSSGYPFFGSFCHAKTFATPEDAENEFKKVKKFILNNENMIPGTLAVRVITFKYVKGLSLK